MKLYIVRHGLTQGNANGTHQSDETPLNAIGLQQAKQLAQRFHTTKVDLIVASPALRTKQTAEEIKKVTKASIQYNPLYKEKRNPSEAANLTYTEAGFIWKKIYEHFDDPVFHYSDEENAHEFIQRVNKGFTLLEKQEEENIILVTHGFVIRTIVGLILKGDAFSPQDFQMMINRFMTKNTGVTFCEYTHDEGWKLIAYNDHSHLLE